MEYSFATSWNNMLQTLSEGLNDWGSLHPFIVHIPIALLLVVPLFIVLGLIMQKSAKPLLLSALILLLLGTLGIYLAVSTGETASELISPTPDVIETLEIHYHLAEQMRLHFSLLTGLFIAYLFLQNKLLKKFGPKIHPAFLTLFLVIYAYNLVLLLNTAHQGGKLVHHHGITSKLFSNVYKSK